MKLRKVLTTILGTAVTVSALGASTQADAEAEKNITVPVAIDTEFTSTVTGYVAEINYNADVLEPLVAGSDILGEDCYAENVISRGYLTADKVSDGTLIVGWADKEAYDLAQNNTVSEITFRVISAESAEVSTDEGQATTITQRIYQVAKYPDVMQEGEYTVSEDYLVSSDEGIKTDEDDVISDEAAEVPEDEENGDSEPSGEGVSSYLNTSSTDEENPEDNLSDAQTYDEALQSDASDSSGESSDGEIFADMLSDMEGSIFDIADIVTVQGSSYAE